MKFCTVIKETQKNKNPLGDRSELWLTKTPSLMSFNKQAEDKTNNDIYSEELLFKPEN